MKSANNTFAFNLLAQCLAQSAGENVFISPFSVAIALSMAHNGALGATAASFAKALALPGGVTLDQVNEANKQLITALETADPDVQLAIANALWARKGVNFRAPFINANTDNYDATMTALDFRDEAGCLEVINNWCSEKTRGKITKILNKIDPNAILYLMNAIYFFGPWQEPFEEMMTDEETFTCGDGTTKQHPLMWNNSEFPYFEGAGFQAVSLPYGNGRLSMKVFLPDEGVDFGEFQKTLTATNWGDWLTNFRSKKGVVRLPKFKLEYEITLNTALKALGMDIAFSDAADFGAVADLNVNGVPVDGFHISEVKHKTFVQVNEEGTEAAAVTSVGMAFCTSISVEQPFHFKADRPFVFTIVDDETGTVLFIGSIVNPEYDGE